MTKMAHISEIEVKNISNDWLVLILYRTKMHIYNILKNKWKQQAAKIYKNNRISTPSQKWEVHNGWVQNKLNMNNKKLTCHMDSP